MPIATFRGSDNPLSNLASYRMSDATESPNSPPNDVNSENGIGDTKPARLESVARILNVVAFFFVFGVPVLLPLGLFLVLVFLLTGSF